MRDYLINQMMITVEAKHDIALRAAKKRVLVVNSLDKRFVEGTIFLYIRGPISLLKYKTYVKRGDIVFATPMEFDKYKNGSCIHIPQLISMIKANNRSIKRKLREPLPMPPKGLYFIKIAPVKMLDYPISYAPLNRIMHPCTRLLREKELYEIMRVSRGFHG
jgi:hypothetical protein